MKRVIFYFDGFNFYNGLKDKSSIDDNWRNYYWLDFITFCKQFLDDEHELVKVNYFTAPPSNNQKRSRQSALFSANKLLHGDLFNVVNGRYLNRQIECKGHCKMIFDHPEEKRTDVSISVQMLLDCFQDVADTLILVTADSDQIPTLQAIKQHFPQKKVKVYFPPERNSADILNGFRPIVFLGDNEDKFRRSIMPVEVSNGVKKYNRPENWKK